MPRKRAVVIKPQNKNKMERVGFSADQIIKKILSMFLEK